MRNSLLSCFISIIVLFLSGCGGREAEKNFAHLADIEGRYSDHSDRKGSVSLTISQDGNGLLSFDTNYGYSGKLQLVEASGEAAGEPAYNDIFKTRFTFKVMDTQSTGDAAEYHLQFRGLVIYPYKTGQGPYGYTATMEAQLETYGKKIDLDR